MPKDRGFCNNSVSSKKAVLLICGFEIIFVFLHSIIENLIYYLL